MKLPKVYGRFLIKYDRSKDPSLSVRHKTDTAVDIKRSISIISPRNSKKLSPHFSAKIIDIKKNKMHLDDYSSNKSEYS